VQYVVRGADHDFFQHRVDQRRTTRAPNPSCDPASHDDDAAVAHGPNVTSGLALMAAFLRRYVGPEPAFQPLMTAPHG